jgi:acetylornithine deacetylase
MITELLSNLVAIPSVNPRVLGGRAGDGEADLARFVHQTFASAGVDVELQEVEPGRHNVVARVGRAQAKDDAVILLSAHMDTYPASDSDAEYVPFVRDGHLHGRGSADAKGSLAAMMCAVLAAARSPRRRETCMVASVDEEFGLAGARRLVSSGLRAHLAITGEPTRLQPIVAQKGIVRFAVTVAGDPAHAAYPRGTNAVLGLAPVLAAVHGFCELLAAEGQASDLGAPTLTATRVESDGDMNRTPNACRLFFDGRFLPVDSSDSFLGRFEGHLRQHVADDIGVRVEPPRFVCPPNRCRQDLPVVHDVFRAIDAETGACRPGSFSYGSEAGVLAEIAEASMVLGPGDPKYSHGPGERVSLTEVECASRIFQRLLVC